MYVDVNMYLSCLGYCFICYNIIYSLFCFLCFVLLQLTDLDKLNAIHVTGTKGKVSFYIV